MPKHGVHVFVAMSSATVRSSSAQPVRPLSHWKRLNVAVSKGHRPWIWSRQLPMDLAQVGWLAGWPKSFIPQLTDKWALKKQ